MKQSSDIALVARVAAFRDNRAFDALVRKYQSPVRRFFLHQTLGDEALSDDLAQDTFLRAYTGLASFKGLASFSTWLFRIAWNVFNDHVRARRESAPLDDPDAEAACAEPPPDPGSQMDLYRALARLKEAERTCITLFYMDDLSIDKISAVTGLPAGTVKSHLSRGKEKLATYLRQNGYDEYR